MRKVLQAALTALAVIAALPPSSYAESHGHGGHGGHGWGHGHGWGYRGWGWGPSFGAGVIVGSAFGWPRPWGYYPPYGWGYGPTPYVYAPPPVVVQQAPSVYVQQQSQGDENGSPYWYYCQNPQGYYPYVSRCSTGWMQVVPPEGPPN